MDYSLLSSKNSVSGSFWCRIERINLEQRIPVLLFFSINASRDNDLHSTQVRHPDEVGAASAREEDLQRTEEKETEDSGKVRSFYGYRDRRMRSRNCASDQFFFQFRCLRLEDSSEKSPFSFSRPFS